MGQYIHHHDHQHHLRLGIHHNRMRCTLRQLAIIIHHHLRIHIHHPIPITITKGVIKVTSTMDILLLLLLPHRHPMSTTLSTTNMITTMVVVLIFYVAVLLHFVAAAYWRSAASELVVDFQLISGHLDFSCGCNENIGLLMLFIISTYKLLVKDLRYGETLMLSQLVYCGRHCC